MVKLRMMGTTRDMKVLCRALKRAKNIDVRSVSDVFPNKGTKKYFRQYVEVYVEPQEDKE